MERQILSHDNYKQPMILLKATSNRLTSLYHLIFFFFFFTFFFFFNRYTHSNLQQRQTQPGLSSFQFLHIQFPSQQVCPGINQSCRQQDHSSSIHGSGAVQSQHIILKPQAPAAASKQGLHFYTYIMVDAHKKPNYSEKSCYGRKSKKLLTCTAVTWLL